MRPLAGELGLDGVMRTEPHNGTSALIRRGRDKACVLSSPSFPQCVRTQREASSSGSQEEKAHRNQPCGHPHLALPVSKTLRDKFVD